jgi:pimeloyl-ACP methyl ester carboxylesterase
MFPAGDDRFVVHSVRTANRMSLRAVECVLPNGRAPTGTVLCLHGWACSAYSYRFVLPLLANAGLRAVALDLPGHGLSDKPTTGSWYTLPAMTGAVREACAALDIASATVVGHSMSGPIATQLALDMSAGPQITSMVLAAPVGFGQLAHLQLATWGTPTWLAHPLPYLAPRWLAWLVLRTSYGSGSRPTERDLDEYWAPSRSPLFVRALQTLLHGYDWQAAEHTDLARVNVPTRIVWGVEDPLIPEAQIEAYGRAIPGSVVERLGHGVGHAVPDEAPDQLVQAIVATRGC